VDNQLESRTINTKARAAQASLNPQQQHPRGGESVNTKHKQSIMNSPSYDQEDAPQTNLTSASRRIRSSGKDASSVAGSIAASTSSAINNPQGKDPEYIPLHELAKGWKAAISWATDPHPKGEARKKNDRGNFPLHSAASFRAPVEVIGEFFLIS
jgi:hypothetical protein